MPNRPLCKDCQRPTTRTFRWRKTKLCGPCRYAQRPNIGRVTGIADLPGFVESVRLLVSREEYAIGDIAMMFGVTRERMRQLVKKHNIPVHEYPRGENALRIWDDSLNRFVPVSRGVLRVQATTSRRSTRQTIKAHVRREYHAHIEAAAYSVWTNVGRPIKLWEVIETASGKRLTNNEVGPWLRGVYGQKPLATITREIAKRTGVEWCAPGRGTVRYASPDLR